MRCKCKARSCDRLSVCPSLSPSVTLVDCDHIGWNSSEITTPSVSLRCSLSADPNIRVWEHPEILAQSDFPPVDLSVGDIRLQIAPKWLRSQWRASPSLFRMVPPLTPTTSPPPKSGFHMPPRYANGHISATGDPMHVWF